MSWRRFFSDGSTTKEERIGGTFDIRKEQREGGREGERSCLPKFVLPQMSQ